MGFKTSGGEERRCGVIMSEIGQTNEAKLCVHPTIFRHLAYNEMYLHNSCDNSSKSFQSSSYVEVLLGCKVKHKSP
uniref:Uncharacterized protein n=1 Tax=Onchocerca volvulus TaxID=6282 RepID=A0A8R1XZ19_ONCVO